MLRKINHLLVGLDKRIIFVAMLLVSIGLGMADYITGPELSFSLFYLGPIMLSTWYGGRRSGLVLSVVASLLWYLAEDATGHKYESEIVLTLNTLFGFGFFVIVMELMLMVRQKIRILANLALTDPLTGLANRRLFHEQLERESARARRYSEAFSIAYIDLDNFKQVNDTMGHDAGDDLLKMVGTLIKANIRESDEVARMGGDEFAILLPEADEVKSRFVIHKLHDRLSTTMEKSGTDVTFSIGCVTFNNPMGKVRDMLKKADELMYEVKRSGKNNISHISYPETTPPKSVKVVNG